MITNKEERTSKAIANALVACLGEVEEVVKEMREQRQALYFGITVDVIEMLNTWASVERNGQRFVVLCEDLKEVGA